MNRTSTTVVALALVILLIGCSTPERFKGVEIGDTPTLITSVPPLLQNKRVSCGPTCVAAVAAYWGKDYSPLISNAPANLVESFAADDLTNLVQSLELHSFVYSGSVKDLENNLQNGRPLIVLIPRPQYQHSPEVMVNGISLQALWELVAPKASHWVIVIGYTRYKIIIQDPTHGRMALSRSRFEQWWKAKRQTCLLMVP